MQAQPEHTDPAVTTAPAPPHDDSAAPQPGNGRGGPLRVARRIGVAIVGSVVLAVGLILLVTPGPAFVVIPIGLGILALEFDWARRWLDRVKDYVRKALPKKQDGVHAAGRADTHAH